MSILKRLLMTLIPPLGRLVQKRDELNQEVHALRLRVFSLLTALDEAQPPEVQPVVNELKAEPLPPEPTLASTHDFSIHVFDRKTIPGRK